MKSIGVHPVPCPVNGKRKYRLDLEKSNDNIHGPPQSAADENTRGKVWFETMDGRRLGRCSVSSSGPNAIKARFVPDAPVDVDEGRLFVETYGTKEAAEAGDRSLLQRYSRDIRLNRR